MGGLFVALQYLLPKHWLTAIVWRIARVTHARVKNFLITRFVAHYDVNIDDVKEPVPRAFASFNDFFVRELKPGARPVDGRAGSIVSPVDGTISSAGAIHAGTILQAKGINYSLEDLLATDLEKANAFVHGCYATIYLAPYNYHRVHAPLDGELVAAHYVPGDLFSVNKTTVNRVPGLFRRNERLLLYFDTPLGPAMVIFIGAMNVGSIATPWSGEVRPRKRGMVDVLPLTRHSTKVQKGDLLGWFNMGSTVILLLPEGQCRWHEELEAGKTVQMGESIGELAV